MADFTGMNFEPRPDPASEHEQVDPVAARLQARMDALGSELQRGAERPPPEPAGLVQDRSAEPSAPRPAWPTDTVLAEGILDRLMAVESVVRAVASRLTEVEHLARSREVLERVSTLERAMRDGFDEATSRSVVIAEASDEALSRGVAGVARVEERFAEVLARLEAVAAAGDESVVAESIACLVDRMARFDQRLVEVQSAAATGEARFAEVLAKLDAAAASGNEAVVAKSIDGLIRRVGGVEARLADSHEVLAKLDAAAASGNETVLAESIDGLIERVGGVEARFAEVLERLDAVAASGNTTVLAESVGGLVDRVERFGQRLVEVQAAAAATGEERFAEVLAKLDAAAAAGDESVVAESIDGLIKRVGGIEARLADSHSMLARLDAAAAAGDESVVAESIDGLIARVGGFEAGFAEVLARLDAAAAGGSESVLAESVGGLIDRVERFDDRLAVLEQFLRTVRMRAQLRAERSDSE